MATSAKLRSQRQCVYLLQVPYQKRRMKKAYKMDTFCFALFKKQWSILAIINVQINPLRQVDGYMHH